MYGYAMEEEKKVSKKRLGKEPARHDTHTFTMEKQKKTMYGYGINRDLALERQSGAVQEMTREKVGKVPSGLWGAVVQCKSTEDILNDALSENKTYQELDQNIELKSGEKDITFGVELEVVNHKQKDVHNTITQVNAENATGGKWSYTYDRSVGLDSVFGKNANQAVGGEDQQEENGKQYGGEWVSVILKVAPETWNSINRMCEFIQTNHGEIKDSCSEHIHVGHQILSSENKADKYQTLFKLYQGFQNDIEYFFRSGFTGEEGSEKKMRKGGEIYAPQMTEKTSDNKTGFFNIMSSKVMLKLKDTEPFKGMQGKVKLSYFKKEKEFLEKWCKEEINESKKGTLFSEYEAIDPQKMKVLLSWIGNKIKDEPLYTCENLNQEELLKLMRDLQPRYLLFEGFANVFLNDALEIEKRQCALNIVQNYQCMKEEGSLIPTIEYRRFNGVKEANIVQANVLLVTSMMRAASLKSLQEVNQLVEECKVLSKRMRFIKFIDFIVEQEQVKQILIHAFCANLNTQEIEEYRQAPHG